jgi:hypothetical protein
MRRKYSAVEFRVRADIVRGGHTLPGDLVHLLGIAAHDAHREPAAARGVDRDLDVTLTGVLDLQAPLRVLPEENKAAG